MNAEYQMQSSKNGPKSVNLFPIYGYNEKQFGQNDL